MSVVIPPAMLASTAQLLQCARNGVGDKLEHPLQGAVAAAIDCSAEARHVLALLVVLDRRDGQPCAPYARCLLLMRAEGRDDPITQSHFDLRLRDYLALELAEVPDGITPTQLQRSFSEHDLTPDERTPWV